MQVNYTEQLADSICRFRKEKGLTQEELAGKLGITFQAVSKWETGQSAPDIALLPLLADIFDCTVGALFGLEEAARILAGGPAPQGKPEGKQQTLRQPVAEHEEERRAAGLPWANDGKFRGVVFEGTRLCKAEELARHGQNAFVFEYRGEARDVSAWCSLRIEGDVEGAASSGGAMEVKGDITGRVSAGGALNVQGDIEGGVNTGASLQCSGDITAEGALQAGGSVSCSDVYGNVDAGSSVSCGDVEGSIHAGGGVKCKDVGGSVYTSGKVNCGSVEGQVISG